MSHFSQVWSTLKGERGTFDFSNKKADQQATQQTQIKEASPEEKALQAQNLQIAQMQAEQMRQAAAEQAAFNASPLKATQDQLNQTLANNLLARVNGTQPILSPEQQAQLDQIYNATRQQGSEDLQSSAQQAANQRGLALSDSPVGNEYLRQSRLFDRDLASQKAASALDLGNASANFNAQLHQFQSGLQQQAFANRLALANSSPASYGLAANLFGQRAAGSPTTSTGTSGTTGYNMGVSGQQAAGYAQGAKALGMGFGGGG